MALVQEIGHSTRIALTIAGMHRSGTSALAGTLSLLGAQAPKTLFSDHWNPKGHFESMPIIEVSNSVLESTGLEVEGWGGLPQNWLSPELEVGFADRFAQAITAEFTQDMIVVKDPRFCRFPRLIAQGVSIAGWQPLFILIYRNPFEVAMSMKRRNGLPIEHNLLIWLRFLLDAEQGTRGFPRVFLSYESLLANWRNAIDGVQQKLGIVFSRRSTRTEAEIDHFLESELRNFNIPGRPSGTALEDWLVSTWDAYVALSEDEADSNAKASLDNVNLALTAASQRLHGLFCRLTETSPQPSVKSSAEEFSQTGGSLLQTSQQQTEQLSSQVSTLMAEHIKATREAHQTNEHFLSHLPALMVEQMSQTIKVLIQSAQEQSQQFQQQIHQQFQEQTQQLISQASVLVAEQVNAVRDAAHTLSLVPAQMAAEQSLRLRMQEEYWAEKLASLQERLNTREKALAVCIERAAHAEAASEQAAQALREQFEKHSESIRAATNHHQMLKHIFDSEMAIIAQDEKQSFDFAKKISSSFVLARLAFYGWPKRHKILRPLMEQHQLSEAQQNHLLPWIGRRRIILGLLRRSPSTRMVFIRHQVMSFCVAAQHKLWWRVGTEL